MIDDAVQLADDAAQHAGPGAGTTNGAAYTPSGSTPGGPGGTQGGLTGTGPTTQRVGAVVDDVANGADDVAAQTADDAVGAINYAEQFPATAEDISMATRQLSYARQFFGNSGQGWERSIHRAIERYENQTVPELLQSLRGTDIPFPHPDIRNVREVICLLLRSKGVNFEAAATAEGIGQNLLGWAHWGL